MFPQKLIRVGLGAGVLLAGVFCAGVFSARAEQDSAAKNKNKGKADLAAAASESSSQSGKKPLLSTKPSTSPVVAATDLDPEKDAYRIGIEDELHISVWREPELSLGVVVRPDGVITLPLLNDISVVGMKTTELASLLTEKLKSYVNEPQVTVIVRSIHSRKVYLVGEVGRQGMFSLNGRLTVMELLAQAGGMGPFAKSDKIYVLRHVGGKQTQIPFNYKKALAGRGDKDNFVLLPGDIVVVP